VSASVQLREFLDDIRCLSERSPQDTIVERVDHAIVVTQGKGKNCLAVTAGVELLRARLIPLSP
jgi:hypothetical protein